MRQDRARQGKARRDNETEKAREQLPREHKEKMRGLFVLGHVRCCSAHPQKNLKAVKAEFEETGALHGWSRASLSSSQGDG